MFEVAFVIEDHEAHPAGHESDHQPNGYQSEDYRVIPVHGACLPLRL